MTESSNGDACPLCGRPPANPFSPEASLHRLEPCMKCHRPCCWRCWSATTYDLKSERPVRTCTRPTCFSPDTPAAAYAELRRTLFVQAEEEANAAGIDVLEQARAFIASQRQHGGTTISEGRQFLRGEAVRYGSSMPPAVGAAFLFLQAAVARETGGPETRFGGLAAAVRNVAEETSDPALLEKLVPLLAHHLRTLVDLDTARQAFAAIIGRTWGLEKPLREALEAIGPRARIVAEPFGGRRSGVVPAKLGHWKLHPEDTVTRLDRLEPEQVTGDPLRISPDGRRVARRARVSGVESVVVAPGPAPRPYPSARLVGFTFSPDSRRFAHLATYGDRAAMVVDGELEGPYDSIADRNTAFSPDAKHCAYGVRRDVYQQVVLDGEPGAPFEDIGECTVRFGPDGRLAYVARSSEGWAVVVDGHRGRSHAGVGVGSPAFSPDGRRLVYSAQTQWGWIVVDNDRDYDRREDIGTYFVFSPDSKRLAYESSADGGLCLVVDRKAGPTVDGIDRTTGVVFSSNSRHFAYLARRAGGVHLMVDDDGGETRRQVKPGSVRFLPDSGDVAFIEQRGDRQVFVAGPKEGRPYYSVRPGDYFAPDSDRCAYAASLGTREVVVVDGEEGPLFERIGSPSFGPRGAHVAYFARRDDVWHLMVDEELRATPWGNIVGPLLFDSDDRFHYLATKGRELFLVEGRV